MPPLYKHQAEFLEKNPDKVIMAFEAGTGKSRTAIEWLKIKKVGLPLIIVTKAIKQKWHDDLKKWGYKEDYILLTKEEFKKEPPDNLQYIDALIVDEAHNFASPLFIAKMRSQVSEALYKLIENKPNMPILLLTANPVRSSPANLHSLLIFRGVNISWAKWRDRFYHLVRRPYLPRPAFEPIKGWQKMMIPIIEKYCHVALMRDCADVPIHEYQNIDIELNNETLGRINDLKFEVWEPMKLWCAEHRLENGDEKLEWIKDFAKGRRKIVIICKYTEQILSYEKELNKDRETFVLNGQTKDQGEVIKNAQESPECFLIVQAQVSAGYDLDQFSTMIFASCSWSWVDHSQCHARINRIHNLHRNEYIYLHAGPKDYAVIESLELKQDFDVTQITNKVK